MDAKTYAIFKNVSSGGGGGASGYDEISEGNITEIDGKKYLTPLGGGIIRKPLNVEFTMTSTEDGITWGEEPIAEGNLIVGETYRVTVNGVTGDYVCFYDGGYPTIGMLEDEMTIGDWQFYSETNGGIWTGVFGNVGDEFSIAVLGKIEANKTINHNFMPTYTMFDLNHYIGLEYELYGLRYSDDGKAARLYITPELVVPAYEMTVLGTFGLPCICSILPYDPVNSFFATQIEFDDAGGIHVTGLICGRTENDAIEVAEDYGFTHRTDPTA